MLDAVFCLTFGILAIVWVERFWLLDKLMGRLQDVHRRTAPGQAEQVQISDYQVSDRLIIRRFMVPENAGPNSVKGERIDV